MDESSLRTERTRVRRQPTRGAYERDDVYEVLDSALFGHVAFVDAEQPFCIPMLQARVDDCVYVHGSSASRAIRALAAGAPACLTVTLLDGLVLARSAFEHSANYRSAVVLGSFAAVEEEAKRLTAFAALTDKLVPGRWQEVRAPNAKELKATAILRMLIEEASVKVRGGPPGDDDSEDATLDVWAGVLPIVTSFGAPEASPGLRDSIRLSPSAHGLLAEDAARSVLNRNAGGRRSTSH